MATSKALERGSITRCHLPTHGFADGVAVQIPMIAVTGSRPGRTLAVVAGQHGREVNGPAAVYRALRKLCPREMAGTILLFPVANPLCVRMQVQDFPTERNRYLKSGPEHLPMNLNRQWPGSRAGDLPQRIAHAIWNARLNDADCVLDLHCWTSTHSALAWGTAESEPLVSAFGFPWWEIHAESAVQPGMLEAACIAHKIPCVVCELTPQDTVDPQMVDHGCRGILNLAKHLGIIEGDSEMPPVRYELGCEKSVSVVARKPGLVVAAHRPGEVIDKGEAAAELIDLVTLRCLQKAAAPERMILRSVGCTWGTGQLGYNVVREGETIARFSGIVRELHRELD